MPPRPKRARSRKLWLSPARRGAIRRRMLRWYPTVRRDLPWRRTRDPYRIWISETMLQQTRVETVVPYYERFLERFSTVEALATADAESVMREWAGLGYYARARNLKRAAELVVRDHSGRIPRIASALSSLPGVGRYTAGAVRSIAFGDPAAAVDGNVSRVLSRVEGLRSPSTAELWDLAEALVPAEAPGDFNQALMELGATVCTPGAPRCPICPLSDLCRGCRAGTPERFPVARVRARPRAMNATAGVIRHRSRPGTLLLVRRPEDGLLGGLWELPNVGGRDVSGLVALLQESFGIRTAPAGPLGEVSHVFTHRKLTLEVIELLHLAGGRIAKGSPARWCTRAGLAHLPLSALVRKTLRLANFEPGSRDGKLARARRRSDRRTPWVDPSPGS